MQNEIDFSLDSAQVEYKLLVDTYRNKALWFMKPDVPVDIAGPLADSILDHRSERPYEPKETTI
jgi:hypothetical protein